MAYYVKKDKNKKEDEKKELSGHSKLLAQLMGCVIVVGILFAIWIGKTVIGG